MSKCPPHMQPGEYDIIHQKGGWYFFLFTHGGKHIQGGPYKTSQAAEADLFSIFDEAGHGYST